MTDRRTIENLKTRYPKGTRVAIVTGESMMTDRKIIENLKKRYSKGTRVALVQMDDVQAPPVGTKGTVRICP